VKPFGWTYWLDGECLSVDMPARVVVNNAEAYIGACLAGLGIIQAPLVGVRSHIEDGSLIEVLNDYSGGAMPVSLIYPNRKHLSKRLQIFMDWLAHLIQAEASLNVKGW
jgi:DNA-binding transcriptional LysR family regulator